MGKGDTRKQIIEGTEFCKGTKDTWEREHSRDIEMGGSRGEREPMATKG